MKKQTFILKILTLIKQDKTALFCLTLLGLFFTLSALAPFFLPHPPNEIYENSLNLPPVWMDGGQWSFPLGTDDLGRDFLSRLLNGGKVSFLTGAIVMLVSLVFGLILGVLSGLYNKLDNWIMGFVDILMSFPSLIFAIIVVAVLGAGLFKACLAVSVMSLPVMIRLVRSLTLREKQKSYVESSRSFGSGNLRLVFYHILPNSLDEITVQSLLNFSEGVLNVAALSFLGLGAQAPLAEWGVMIADGRAYLETAWWLVSFPGICLLITIFCVNILGEKLRAVYSYTV